MIEPIHNPETLSKEDAYWRAKYSQPFGILKAGREYRIIGLFAEPITGIFRAYIGAFNARGGQYVTLELPAGGFYDCARAHVRKIRARSLTRVTQSRSKA